VADPATPRRGFRDRPLGKLALLVGLLLLALVVARGCAGAGSEISKEEAIAIAVREVDYRPDRTQVRLVRQGFQSRPFWAVSLSTLDDRGNPDRVTVVVVDARTREVSEVRESDQ
jgi:hypothetical protein